MNNPVEIIIYDALVLAGVRFRRGEGTGELDFYLLDSNVCIECKQFHTERTLKQLASQPNVILIQGMDAAKAFHGLIRRDQCKPI